MSMRGYAVYIVLLTDLGYNKSVVNAETENGRSDFRTYRT